MVTREKVKFALRAARIGESLRRRGLEIKCVRKEHYSKLRFDCYGRLQDGRVRYSHRMEASGRTYPVRGVLKAAGWRWDGGAKVWHAGPDDYSAELGGKLCRALEEAC